MRTAAFCYIFIIILTPFLVPAQNPFSDPKFTIFDIRTISPTYSIITCRGEIGKTVQFEVRSRQNNNPRMVDMHKRELETLQPGTIVIPDFTSGTVHTPTNNTIKYRMIKPVFSTQCCLVTKIQQLTSATFPSYLIIAKQDTANGLTYFSLKSGASLITIVPFQVGQQIYERNYGNNRYAVLKASPQQGTESYLFYSYPFSFMTNETYANLPKEEVQNDHPAGTPLGVIVDSTAQWETLTTISLGSGWVEISSSPGAIFTINLYNPADHTKLFSTNEKVSFTYSPGTYDIEVSGMMVNSVPLNTGLETKIKTGTLNITSSSSWTLYDEAKNQAIYSSTGPKKVVFPVGIYQLEMNGAVQQIEIRRAEIVTYGDAQTQSYNTGGNTQPWEMQIDAALTGVTGQMVLEMPKNIKFMSHLQAFRSGESQAAASWFGNSKSRLTPGLYDVKVEKYIIRNVPIEKGKTTRLKMGFLQYSPRGSVRIVDANQQEFAMAGPFKIALPPGIYYINGRKDQTFVIKDGELTEY